MVLGHPVAKLASERKFAMVLRMGRARLRSHPVTYGLEADEDGDPQPDSGQAAGPEKRTDSGLALAHQRFPAISEPPANAEPRHGILIVVLTALTFLAIALAL